MKNPTIITVITLLAMVSIAGSVNAAEKKNAISESSGIFTNSISMKFVKVTPGTFMMGLVCKKPDDPFMSDDKYNACIKRGGEGWESNNREKPAHSVTISQPFWIGQYEVTQEQWYMIMGNNPAYFKSDKVGENSRTFPVENVSWNDAQEFIRRLNAKDGKQYRLPTEAEWEYACRSGGKDEKYCGGNDSSELGWYESKRTHRVGTKRPNGLGIYDMSGNVKEWVSDWFDEDYYLKSPVNDPQGPTNGRSRVNRGGGWEYELDSVIATGRIDHNPDTRYNSTGFRLAFSSVP